MANPYFTCELEAWRSGQTLYGRMHYYRTDGLTYTYTDYAFPDPTMNLGGAVYTDTAFGNAVRNGIDVGSVYTTTFSRVVSGSGTRTVTFTASAGERGDFEGTWSKDVIFPVPYVAPDTPTISATATGPTSISITYGTTSFGNPSTGIVTLYGDTTANPTTSIDTTNTTGDKTYTYTGLTPNTTYYFRAKANNGQLDSAYSTEITVTTPINNGLYGSVNGEAKRVIKLYGPVEETIYEYRVTNFYGINNFDSTKFNSAYQNKFVRMTKKPAQLIMNGNTNYGEFGLRYDDNSYDKLVSWTSNTQYFVARNTWGIGNAISQSPWTAAYSSSIYYRGWIAKKITKLYGSVNGQTKLIFSD